MTRQLRSRHLRIWLALAVLLPAVFAAALTFRRPEPVNDKLPAAALVTEKVQ